MSKNTGIRHVTIIIPGGQITPEQMATINEVTEKYSLTFYLTTAQNLRLIGASEVNIDSIKKDLNDRGFVLKGPGKFPMPKVCVGLPYCNLGLADTFSLSDRIFSRFGDRSGVKPKFKIAISGCPACCGGSKLADIGIIATRKGFDVYVGGKGGPLPRVGSRIAKGVTDDKVLEIIGTLADFHAANTPKKLRMFKLMDEPDFPYPAET